MDIEKLKESEWAHTVTILLTVTGLFLWQRTESRNDYREIRMETQQSIAAIQAEMKDFHGRLCAIEERNKAK